MICTSMRSMSAVWDIHCISNTQQTQNKDLLMKYTGPFFQASNFFLFSFSLHTPDHHQILTEFIPSNRIYRSHPHHYHSCWIVKSIPYKKRQLKVKKNTHVGRYFVFHPFSHVYYARLIFTAPFIPFFHSMCLQYLSV